MTKTFIQIGVFVATLFSGGLYIYDAYPKYLEDVLIIKSLAVYLLCHVVFLFSYYAFYLRREIPLVIYSIIAVVFVIFFNMFFLSLKSQFAPFGIITILIFLVLSLLLEKKNNKYTNTRHQGGR